MSELQVVHGGISATVQDLGRWQFQKFGVPVGGAMDVAAHRLANALVGNPPEAATIEIAWFGFAFSLCQNSLVAITDADLQPTAQGQRIPLHRPIWFPAKTTVKFQHPTSGCYAYLAIAGGIETSPMLQSRATNVRANLGGVNGQALKMSDVLPLGQPTKLGAAITETLNRESNPSTEICAATWFVRGEEPTPAGKTIIIHAIRGRHFQRLDDSSQRRFWNSDFVVSQDSDRMGYRLVGPELNFAKPDELESAAVSRGTIQLPIGGNPIALMADAATSGGYLNIAHVATAEISKLAQAQPGHTIRFCEIDLAQAQMLIAEQAERFRRLQRSILFRIDSEACRNARSERGR